MLSNSTNTTERPLYRKMFYFVTLINATDIGLLTDINSLCYVTYTPHLKLFQTKWFTVYIQSAISDKLDKLDLTSVSLVGGFSEVKKHLPDVFHCTASEKCVRMSILWVVRHENGLTVSPNCILLVYIAINNLKFYLLQSLRQMNLNWKKKTTTVSNVPIVAIDVTSLSLTGNRDWVLCIEYEVFI